MFWKSAWKSVAPRFLGSVYPRFQTALFYNIKTTREGEKMNAIKDSRPPTVCARSGECADAPFPTPSQFAQHWFGRDQGHITAYCLQCREVVPVDIKGNCLRHGHGE